MCSSLVVVTPPRSRDSRIALAAVRAGEWGILDLGWREASPSQPHALQSFLSEVDGRRNWGIRVDIADSVSELIQRLAEVQGLLDSAAKREANPSAQPILPLLLIAGVSESSEQIAAVLSAARPCAEQVWIEAYGVESALQADQLGYDAVVLKGNESGGRVAPQSAFLLLQHLRDRLAIPFWVQGGMGPQTAAAAMLAGAAGVVLCEQLWLTEESPFTAQEQRVWRQLDGSETICIGSSGQQFRVSARVARLRWQKLMDAFVTGAAWPATAYEALAEVDGEEILLPMGQEIGLAATLARRHHRVGAVLAAYRQSIENCLKLAPQQQSLLPEEAPLAQTHKTRFPIAQGPMTRVSDVAPFCKEVAAAGALPFLALALLREGEVRRLLTEAKEQLGSLPWGVGILGFVPAELRKEQMAVVRELPPTYAIVAGGRPSQVRELEAEGILTYLHVPSPGLLQSFLNEGARKFIFEGRECGGHVGPQSSFNLWQNAIDVLLDAPLTDPENVQLLFAGGIHDRFSAAMVATLAAPLVARGMKIGVLMGTAYLFTSEIVSSGAINAEFQRQAIACGDTALLESGVGHATRCAITPFVDEFNERKRELVEEGASSDKIREELEIFNIGRLRIASKGVDRVASAPGETRSPLIEVNEEQQRARGMYMIGEIAALRSGVISAQELHEEVTTGSVAELQQRATRPLPWQTEAYSFPPGEDLAIVGLGCMFPESPNVRAYWQNIVNRFDAIREVTPDRWHADAYFSPERMKKDQVYSKWGSFLEDIVFDPLKYSIPPATLSSIEPVQLLALEVASEALADAGYDQASFPRKRTSVLFAAAGTHDLGMGYAFRTMMRHYLPQAPGLSAEQRTQLIAELEQYLPEWTEDSFAGFLMNVIAGRIANRFDLGGTNFTVDAACASSLAALQTAVEQLRTHTCDAVLVGAVDGTNNPFCFMSFAKTHALSPRGRSRPFDQNADGIALGEGVAALVLKRLSDAERDGDKIYAVLKGIGSSSDGRNRSLTAPFPAGQLVALERAYRDADVAPESVTLLEAHSTGTAVGDRVEISALQEMLRTGGAPAQACGIGSVKSMIGHTKTAAGLASLIKTTLALKHRLLPSTLGVQEPNEEFKKDDSPLYVLADNRPWLDNGQGTPRRAGVSAFGFGGTNFHVVLEEYGRSIEDGGAVDLNPRPAEVFAWSRTRARDLVTALESWRDQLQLDLPLDLAQLAYSQWCDEQRRGGRTAGIACRLAISATSVDDLRGKISWSLDQLTSIKTGSQQGSAPDAESATQTSSSNTFERPDGVYYRLGEAIDPESICFLFPGQGSQAVDMLKELVLSHPEAFETFLQADALLQGRLPRKLSRYIFPPAAFTEEVRDAQQQELNDTRVAQPALAVLELFCLDLLRVYGVQPGSLAGHSFGEYAALCAAGTISRRDLIHLAARRGAVMHAAAAAQPGGMAAVFAGERETARALEDLEIDAVPANHNAPDQTVIAGPNEAIEAALVRLKERNLRIKRIPVCAAFHTPAMLGAAEAFATDLNAAKFTAPVIPVFSNVTADLHPTDTDALRGLLIRHITEPVRFVDQVRSMYQRGARVFVECGPGNVLTGLVRRILGDEPHITLGQASAKGNGAQAFANNLSRLFSLGLALNLEPAFANRRLEETGVTSYFQSVRMKQERKPTDWLVNASRAISVRALQKSAAAASAAPVKLIPDRSTSIPISELPESIRARVSGPVLAANSPSLFPAASGSSPEAAASHEATAESVATVQAAVETQTAHIPVLTQAVEVFENPVEIRAAHPTASSPLRTCEVASPLSQKDLFAMNNAPDARPSVPAMQPTAAEQSVFHSLQSTLSQWLVLQQSQMQVSVRFLETQERIAMACLNGAAIPALTGAMSTAVLSAPVAAPPSPVLPTAFRGAAPVAASPAVAVPVTPTAPKPRAPQAAPVAATKPTVKAPGSNGHSTAATPVAHTNGSNGSTGSNGSAAHAPVPVATPVAAVASAGAKLPPPTEEFKEALLQAVSDRTGYPVEMLGIDRQLEADLGIDSIKTVEIFSSLKEFHVYLPGGDQNQEESLAEFASMKTLRDIITVYDRRRSGVLEENGASVATAAPAVAVEPASTNGAKSKPVERYTLEAAEAPLSEADAKKKTSRNSTSC